MSFLCEWGSGSRSGKCWLRESDRAAVQQLTVWDECSNWIRSEALKIRQFKRTSMCPHVTPCIWWYCVVAHLILMIKQWFLVVYLRPVLQQCWAHEWWPAVTSWYWRFHTWQILKDKETRHDLAALRIPPGVWERERWKRPPCPRWRGLRPPRRSQLPNPDDDFSVRNFM